MSKLVRAAIVALALCGGLAAGPAAAKDVSSSQGSRPSPGRIGINVGGFLSTVDPDIIFVDAFKQSSPWKIGSKYVQPGSAPPRDPGVSAIDANGWVTSLRYDQQAVAPIYQFADGHYPAGVYTVLYDGDGDLSIQYADEIDRSKGKIRVKVTPRTGPTAGIRVVLRSTNPANPVRNIRVILPGFETSYSTDPWYPPYIAMLKPFDTVRFTNWFMPSLAIERSWSDRRPVTYATQANLNNWTASTETRGVSAEYVVALANKLNANPWVTVPIEADDDYVRQLARMFHAGLNKNLHPTVEYGNETWNRGYKYQLKYLSDRGLALNLTTDPNVAHLYFYALRTSQIFDIWNAEYGTDRRNIVHVVAVQTTAPAEADAILAFGQKANRLADKTDVIAMGGYVSPFSMWSPAIKSGQVGWADVATMTPPQLIKAMHDSIDTRVGPLFERMQQVARKWNLGLVAYEGGDGNEASHTPAPYQAPVLALYTATARDPAMAGVYKHLLDTWAAAGGTLFNQYNTVSVPSVWGEWGMLEYQDQPLRSSAKFVGLTDWMAAHGSPGQAYRATYIPPR